MSSTVVAGQPSGQLHSGKDAGPAPAGVAAWRPLFALAVTAPLLPLLLYMDKVFAGFAGWLWHGGIDPARLAALDLHIPEVISSLMAQGLSLLTVILLAGLGGSQVRNQILLFRVPRQGPAITAVLPFVFVAVSIVMLIAIARLVPYTTTDALKVDALIANSGYGYLVLLMYVVGAPLAEEFLFRGFLYSAFAATRLGVTGAGIATSVLWAQIHWWGPAPMLLHIFGMGLLLSFIARRTGSIWTCVACHGLWNGIAFWLLLNPIG